MVATLLNTLISGLKGNRTRRSQQPREVAYGDVVCVAGAKASHPATAPALGLPWPSEGDFLKRYAIWTGENFILYGEDRSGRDIVHEESFRGFLHGIEYFAICEFPKEYGRPTEWEQPSPVSSVVMPQEKLWRLLERGRKAREYRRYSPHETVRRAKSKLGQGGYLTSEHFAMWCKTGIAESHELESIRDFWERMIVY